MILWISLVFLVMSSFLSLIILICILSLFLLVSLVKSLLILFVFLKNQLFVSLVLYMFFFPPLLISSLMPSISFHVLLLGLVCSCFSKSLSCSLGYLFEISLTFLM
jgi:hypothetical protein